MKKNIISLLLALFFCGIGFAQSQTENPDSISAIVERAKDGDAEAMILLGDWFYTGTNVERDYTAAFKWYRHGAIFDNAKAMARLARCYRTGNGVEADSVAAIKLYEKSIRLGNKEIFSKMEKVAPEMPFAAMLLGHCYENGIGTARDFNNAANFYAYAADAGSIEGMRHAGLCFLSAKDSEKAYNYFNIGMKADDLSCTYWAGKMLLGGMGIPEDSTQAILLLQKAADGGMAAAQNELAKLYRESEIVDTDLIKSTGLFREAAEQQLPEAMWNYAVALKQGDGIDANTAQALDWMALASGKGYKRTVVKYLQSLDKKDIMARYLNALKLFHVDKNYEEAEKQFKKLKKDGIEEADVYQAIILTMPENPKRDVKKGLKQLEELASVSGLAAYRLVEMYMAGEGVEEDSDKAMAYIIDAIILGYDPDVQDTIVSLINSTEQK